MDKTETYIKMCEMAKEIQHWWINITKDDENTDHFQPYDICARWPSPLRCKNFLNSTINKCIKGLNEKLEFEKKGDAPEIRVILPNSRFTWWYDNEWVWLPRQDQLQEMVTKKSMGFRDTLKRFNLWFSAEFDSNRPIEDAHYLSIFTSMEQLWLAFVMKEKYKKVWNSEKEEWEEL